VLSITQELEKSLSFARRCGHLKGGLEKIEMLLDNESKGIVMAHPGKKSQNTEKKLSRLLLLSNDGSDRFYRQAETILEKNNQRLAVVVLDSTSFDLGIFFGASSKTQSKPKAVKALLIDKKDFVQHFFSKISEHSEN
jgi:hypothetical protein